MFLYYARVNTNAINLICEYLQKNRIIVNLKLGHIGIGNSDYSQLFDAIKQNTSLVHLDLSGNDLEIENGEQFLELIRSAELEELNLSQNKIGNQVTLY